MDLPIRFVTTPSGARNAYATIGEGPPLVWGPKWISHLERLWVHSAFRSFMRTLAGRHTVVLYDRYGCGLSKREVEVALLVARGLSNRQIGTTLTISERTAEAHVAHILDKLAMTSRSQVAAWTAETGLLMET